MWSEDPRHGGEQRAIVSFRARCILSLYAIIATRRGYNAHAYTHSTHAREASSAPASPVLREITSRLIFPRIISSPLLRDPTAIPHFHALRKCPGRETSPLSPNASTNSKRFANELHRFRFQKQHVKSNIVEEINNVSS